MNPPSSESAAMTQERLRWIETWAKGWSGHLGHRSIMLPESPDYAGMPLDVATSMIEELVTALRDPNHALDLIADVLHESGQEIAETIERRRYEVSANATEARRG